MTTRRPDVDESALDRAVVKILAGPPGERSRGTGTLVAPGLVLTALHVVADRFQDPPRLVPEGTIELTFVKAGLKATATVVEGCFDPDEDWVLLRFEADIGLVPAPVGTLGEDERGPAAEFRTFGFPNENKGPGLAYFGYVADPATRYAGSGAGPRKPAGAPAILLRCDAARGDDIAGLSGGPCFVDGALVGLIRSTLTDPDELSKGHLYACPLAVIVARIGDKLPLVDPYRGLPGLPHRDLPGAPFRYLERYTEADAEIFFGRGRSLRKLYSSLMSDDAPPAVLLFGGTGVGKSSFLDAGLVPRLRAHREPLYVRRDADNGLAATLTAALEHALGQAAATAAPVDPVTMGEPPKPPARPAGLWRALEQARGKPVIVLLDQVEEAYTRPRAGGGDAELDELATWLTAMLGDPATRPRGRIVLSFRKEWLAEIRARLSGRSLSFSETFLHRLGAAGVDEIDEIVLGPESTDRIRKKWQIEVSRDLPAAIRNDLLSDAESPVAPTLQIVMSRMFDAVKDSDDRSLSVALYLKLKTAGLLFRDFIPQQIQLLSPQHAPLVASGLVDDVLEYHTTEIETAGEHDVQDVQQRYRHAGNGSNNGDTLVTALLEDLKRVKLLTDPSSPTLSPAAPAGPADASPAPGVAPGKRIRLVHDTLAPLVRARLRASGAPGARARRALERLAPGREGQESGRLLESQDLRVVELGRHGMRALSGPEETLVTASRSRRRQLRGLALLGGLATVIVGVLLAGLWIRSRDAERDRASTVAQSRARAAFDRAQRERDPVTALLWACRAVELAQSTDPMLPVYVARAQHLFAEGPVMTTRVSRLPVRAAALDDTWTTFALRDAGGAVHAVKVNLSCPAKRAEPLRDVEIQAQGGRLGPDVAVSPGGQWVAATDVMGAESQPYTALLWSAEDGKEVLRAPLMPACAPLFFDGPAGVGCCGFASAAERAKGTYSTWPVARREASWTPLESGTQAKSPGCEGRHLGRPGEGMALPGMPSDTPDGLHRSPLTFPITWTASDGRTATLGEDGTVRVARSTPIPELSVKLSPAERPPLHVRKVPGAQELTIASEQGAISVWSLVGTPAQRPEIRLPVATSGPNPGFDADSPYDVQPGGGRIVVALAPTQRTKGALPFSIELHDSGAKEPRRLRLRVGGTGKVDALLAGSDTEPVTVLYTPEGQTSRIVGRWDKGDALTPFLSVPASLAAAERLELTRSGAWVVGVRDRALDIGVPGCDNSYSVLPRFSFRSKFERDLALTILHEATRLEATFGDATFARIDAQIGPPSSSAAGGGGWVALISIPAAATISPSDGPKQTARTPFLLPAGDETAGVLAFSASAGLVASIAREDNTMQLGRDPRLVGVYSTTTGVLVARLRHPDGIAAALFSDSGDSLWTVDWTLTAQRFFLGERSLPASCGGAGGPPCAPSWLKDLATFVSSYRVKDPVVALEAGGEGVSFFEPNWTFGAARDDFMARLRASAAASDRGAQHVLRQIEGK